MNTPPLWQSDIQRDEAMRGNQAGPSTRDLGRRFQSSEAVNEAYRHVTEVAQCRRDADLYDLLGATRREDTYQPYVAGVRPPDALTALCNWALAGSWGASQPCLSCCCP